MLESCLWTLHKAVIVHRCAHARSLRPAWVELQETQPYAPPMPPNHPLVVCKCPPSTGAGIPLQCAVSNPEQP